MEINYNHHFEGPLDPLMYIGLVTRRPDGKVDTIKVIYDNESVDVTDGMEFITFKTVILLEE